MAREGRWIAGGIALALMLGCGKREAPPFPDYAPAPRAQTLSSDDSFSQYVRAAEDVEARAREYLAYVAFTGRQRPIILDRTQQAIEMVQRGTRARGEFPFVPREPFTVAPRQMGWRLIGKALVWRIEDAANASDYDRAIVLTGVATRFGFDLSGGDATDATLGYGIVDDARETLAPHLPKMTPAQLERLAGVLRSALERKPELEVTLRNEYDHMLMAVDAIQEAYQKGDLSLYQKKLGPGIRDAVVYLKDLKANDATARPRYFAGFAEEAKKESDWQIAMAKLPAAKREKAPEYGDYRPWRRFAGHFFRAGRPLLAIHDRTLARTRLFALSALTMRIVKLDRQAPDGLGRLPKDLVTDPYSGEPFVYRSDGMQFRIYSVGANMTDDGGATDTAFTTPDLLLEGAF